MNWFNKLLGKPYCEMNVFGTKYWYLNGELHRADGPAVERANGNKFWYLNGQLHRVEVNPETGLTMPAVECADGTKCWYLNDQRHRIDGPACEYSNGGTEYWINGNHVQQLYNKRIYGKENLQKFLMLL